MASRWRKILQDGRVRKWLCGGGLLLRLILLAIIRRKKLAILSRFGGMGDILCTFPAVQEFVRRHPNEQVVYVTRTSYCELVERGGLGIPCLGVGMQILLPKRAAALVGRHIHMTYADEDDVVPPPPVTLIESFGRGLGLDHLPDLPVLKIDQSRVDEIRNRHLQVGKQLIILLHTGPTWKVKECPLEYWTGLVARLNEDPGTQVLQLCADRNLTVEDAWCANVPGATAVPCTDDLGTLIHTVAASDLLIGIDSGPVHIAGAVGTRSVALFGPTDPARLLFSPDSIGVTHHVECSFCHHRRPRLHRRSGCPNDIACMKGITLDRVLEKSRELLGRREDARR